MNNHAEESVVIRNIYYMMAYAYRALSVGEYVKLASEKFESPNDLLAAVLSLGLSLQFKRGLEKDYRELGEDLSSIRGRIDVRETMKLASSGTCKAHCRHDELSQNTLKNQILKATAMRLINCADISNNRRHELKRCLLKMRDMDAANLAQVEWERLAYHRNNGGYQLLMAVCRMVAEGLIPNEDTGGTTGRSFLSDRSLSALYEKFVLEYFRRHHPELNANAKIIEPPKSEERPSFLPALKTDVTLERGDHTLIIDCKCYGRILRCHYGHGALSAANVNQIHMYVSEEAYVSNKHVEGMLLYAKTLEEVEESSWSVAGLRYHLRTLDLGVEFAQIARQLDDIAGMLR